MGSISGIVEDGSCTLGLSGVQVCAENSGATICTTTYSDGIYLIPNVPGGTYYVMADTFGNYEFKQINNVIVEPGEEIMGIDFCLGAN